VIGPLTIGLSWPELEAKGDHQGGDEVVLEIASFWMVRRLVSGIAMRRKPSLRYSREEQLSSFARSHAA